MTATEISPRLSLRDTRLFNRAEFISFLCFCLCVFDCALTGSGHYIEIFGLSPRILLGGLSVLLILPKVIANYRTLLRNPILLSFGAFLVYLAICALRGRIAGNNPSVWLTDLKGFLWLALVPVAMLTVTTKARLNRVLFCVMAGAVAQALLVIYINGFCTVNRDYVPFFFDSMQRSGLGTLSVMTRRIVRVFPQSCPYLVFACCIALFRQLQSQRIHWPSAAVIVLCLTAGLLSFTRSLYGCILVAAGVGVLALVLFYRRAWRRWGTFLLVTLVAFGCFTFVLERAFDARYTAFALHRTFGTSYTEKYPSSELPPAEPGLPASPQLLAAPMPPAESAQQENAPLDPDQQAYEEANRLSEQIRQTTLVELNALIKQAPLFGNGLGACAPSRNGPDEYFYHDILARMGIVGLLLYLAPFALVLLRCFRRRKALLHLPQGISLICGMCGFWTITYFNPWMNASLGIAMYALFCALPGLLDSVKIKKKKEVTT